MQIGKTGDPVSHICQAYPDRVEVRGRDLCDDLIGRLSFTEYFHLLLTGGEPTDDQRYFLDLLLIAIAEHGMMPTNVAARMTLDADPDRSRAPSRQASSAAARSSSAPPSRALSCSRRRRRGCSPARRQQRSPTTWRARSTRPAARLRGSAIRFTDRSTRAQSAFSSSPTHAPSAARTSLLARLFRAAVAAAWGKPLTMNVSMPIAAVLLDLGFAPVDGQVDPAARAHRRAAGAPRRGAGEPGRVPDGGRRRRAPSRTGQRGRRGAVMLAPDVESRRGTNSSRSTTRAIASRSGTSSSARCSIARS